MSEQHDDSGFMEKEYEGPDKAIAYFLEQEIQSIKGCEFYLDVCRKIEDGNLPLWEGTGNAHTVTITLGSVKIMNEYDEAIKTEMPFPEFHRLLKNWWTIINSK